MKDEIKEILEDNGELIVRYKDNSFECFDTLPKNVLDYITNLQESEAYYYGYYKDYKSRIDKIRAYCKESSLTIKSHYFSDILNIIEGDDKNE